MLLTQDKNQSVITTEVFLTEIHGPGSPIYFNVDSITWKNKPQTYQQAMPKLKKRNSAGDDICFIVNSGGTKNSQITNINTSFIDWDCGRDINGKYYPIEVVKQNKAIFLKELYKSPILPTFIVETRNGYQAYWLLHPGSTSEQFIEVQQRLAYYFKSDPVITNPARVMRLPGYNWVKSSSGYPPYHVCIIEYSPCRYYISSLFDVFPSVSQEEFNLYKEQNTTKKARISAHNNNYCYYKEYTRSIYVGTYPQENITVDDMGQAIDVIKRINPSRYLGVESEKDNITLPCPFHEDTQHSASLYKYDGYYYLKCHSSNCDYDIGTIIDVVMKQEDCSIGEAVNILMNFYNIKMDDSWKAEQYDILERNIKIVENIDIYKPNYPYLYAGIGRIKADLTSKLVFAKDHISLKSCAGEFMFVCSLRKFEEIRSNGVYHEGDMGRQNERIDRYCLLGLMRKMADEEIPVLLLKNANEQRRSIQKSYSKNVNMPRAQFYTIPEYTPELLQEADNTMRTLKESGVRMNAISRDLIVEIFGEEKATMIYPQVKYKTLSKSGRLFREKVKSLLLADIEAKGYSMVKGIVKQLQKEHNWKQVTDRRVKKYIPGLLIELGLTEITANKANKNKHKIESLGYPKIVIKNII